jgi:LysR family pca operon transcriptional activator
MESIDLGRRVKLRHLRVFLEVARRRSLAAAADRLALGQPAISKTLTEFEGIVGQRLLTRSRRGATLTPAGAALLPRVAASLSEIARGLDAARGLEAPEPETVRVGALPTVAAHLAPEALRRLRATGDRTVVRLVGGPNVHILDLLREDRLDLVIGRLAAPETMIGLAFEHLYSEAVRFVVRPGHPLLAEGRPAPERLSAFPFILPDGDAVIRPAVDRLLIAIGAGRPRDRVESVSDAFGRNLVRDSDMIWLISEGVVARDLADGTLATLPIDAEDTRGPVGLTTRAAADLTPAARRFAEAARAAARDLRGDAQSSSTASSIGDT